ncbi:MAG: tRNA 2-thiocytidine biosynthesis TtcA family protein [Bacilli bacterium]|nr:tRNA 2-thiocytidine biosynthesis TtcA family protein [Bacilli bacterium]
MSIRQVLGSIKQADTDFDLIKDNDRIVVGISGGKDSIVLAYCLKLYKFFSKKNYEFICVHINSGFENENLNETKAFLESENIPFYIVDSNPLIYEVLKLNKTNKDLLPCSICSRMRKAAINKAAHTFNANKVAFAHHADDAIETLFMNMIKGGRIATFEPKMFLSNEKITFIRPLIYAREKQIVKATKEKGLPIEKSFCPNDKQTNRESTKKLLREIYHLYPEAKENFLTMLKNKEQLKIFERIDDEYE